MTEVSSRGPTVHLGTTTGPYLGRVDEDAAVAFALATNDPNEACRDGSVVPPLFTVSLLLDCFEDALAASVDPGAILGERSRVHAEHDVSFHHPVLPGMEVQWTVTAHAVRQTPAGVLLTQRFDVTDGDGRLLVRHLWSTMRVGATTASTRGPALPDHRYPDDAGDRLVATQRFELTRDQGFRYAGASGDRAPHALDDERARREGYPSKILQGMCSMAMAGAAAVKWGAGGDPSALRRLAVRFAAPVFPNRELTVELAEAGSTTGGGRVLAFEARQGEVTCLRHGRAELS